MRKATYTESAHTGGPTESAADGLLATSGLPNRLMTAYEVAAFVGCHEETVRRAYLRGLLVLAALRRQKQTLSSARRARLDFPRSANASLVNGITKEQKQEGGRMTIRRRCRGPCRTSRRCLDHLWFDVTQRGDRYRMPVNAFAVPRMEPGKQRPIESMEEARDWSACSSARLGWTRPRIAISQGDAA